MICRKFTLSIYREYVLKSRVYANSAVFNELKLLKRRKCKQVSLL